MPPQQQDGADPNKAAQLAQLLQYGGAAAPQAGPTPPASAIAPQGTFGQPMGPLSSLDQQLQQLIAQGSQMGLQQEPSQLARAQAVGNQTAPLLAQQAAQAQNVPQMPGMHMRPIHSLGSLLYDIGQGALGLGMATRPGQIIREQMYEQRLAPWEERNKQLASAITSSQAQQQTEQQPLATEAGLIYHPMMAGGEGMRGEAGLAEADVRNVMAGTEFQKMLQGWGELGVKQRLAALEVQFKPLEMEIKQQMANNPTQVANILANAKQSIENVAAQSDIMKEHGVLADIDQWFNTTFMPTAPQAPGGAAPTGAPQVPPAKPNAKPAVAKSGTKAAYKGADGKWYDATTHKPIG